jgi:hypothetical protein
MSTKAQSQRGRTREVDIVKLMAARGWFAIRAASGPVDVVAFSGPKPTWHPNLPDRHTVPYKERFLHPLFVQAKSTAGGPYERFGPADREAFLAICSYAGADPWLAWWPAHARSAEWIPGSAFPRSRP